MSPSECSANHMAEKTIIFFSLLWRICVVADFPLDFSVVSTVSVIMIRLRYVIESCHSLKLCCSLV